MSEDKYPLPTLSEIQCQRCHPVPTEHLIVDGVGSTRETALAHADSQARQYFGNGGKRIVREIGRAGAHSTNLDGTAGFWTIRVEYRRNARREWKP